LGVEEAAFMMDREEVREASASSLGQFDCYLKNPNLLVDLCREVITQLEIRHGNADDGATETQLREISRAIERLEKASVPIPDPLRAEKTRLAAALASASDVTEALVCLADGLEDVLNILRARLGQRDNPSPARRRQRKRSSSQQTGREVLREQIIKALKKLGGHARSVDVVAEVGREMEGHLLPGDLEWRKSFNACVWQHNVHWTRYQMMQDGALRTDSRRGVWELNEDPL
jgi:hypothetical protein